MRQLFTQAVLLSLFVTATVAADVTVRLVDGSAKTGATPILADGKLTLSAADGKTVGSWVIESVARIELPAPSAAAPGDSMGWVDVVGGRLRGVAQSFDGDHFAVKTAYLGELKLPVACVRRVLFQKADPAGLPDRTSGKDIVVLSNGDRVSGTLNTLDAKSLAFNSDLGDLTLQRDRVAAVCIAPVGRRPVKATPALKLTFAGGGELELAGVTIAGGKATGTLFGGPKVTVALTAVAGIAVVGGRLEYLEEMKPTIYEQTSLDILKWDIRAGLNVLGQPIRLRRKTDADAEVFAHGLGTHGPCRIVYALAGRYERFIALVGIDESAGRWADVNIVVRLDGKQVFRADHLKWQQGARTVNVPVAGAKTLELVVEAGEHFDVQDRVNWADARVIRSKGK
jgi:NPCBM/NEW2 domain-containing protein